jgi:hypothetical protein
MVTLLTPLVHIPLVAGLIVSNVARRTVWICLLFPSTVFLSGV